MMDFDMMDELCVNCGQSLNSKLNDPLEIQDSNTDEISTSLASIYKLHYLNAFMDSPHNNNHSNNSNNQNSSFLTSSVNADAWTWTLNPSLCSDCLPVFRNLWRFYQDFNHLRTLHSLQSCLAQEIQKLDNFIQAIEINRRVKKEPDSLFLQEENREEAEELEQEQVYDVDLSSSIDNESQNYKVPANRIKIDGDLLSSSSSSALKAPNSGPWIVVHRLENDPVAQSYITRSTGNKSRKQKRKSSQSVGRKASSKSLKIESISSQPVVDSDEDENIIKKKTKTKSTSKIKSKNEAKSPKPKSKKVKSEPIEIKPKKSKSTTKKSPKTPTTTEIIPEIKVTIEDNLTTEEIGTNLTTEESIAAHLDDDNFSPPPEENTDSDFEFEAEKSDSDDEWVASPKPTRKRASNPTKVKRERKPREPKVKKAKNVKNHDGSGEENTLDGSTNDDEEDKGKDKAPWGWTKTGKKRKKRSDVKFDDGYRTRKLQCANPCWHCEMDFLTQQDCYDHAKSVHFKPGNFICERCARVTHSKRAYTWHGRKCEALKPGQLLPLFKCEKCPREFPLIHKLRAHMFKHRDPGHFRCHFPDCDYQTKYKYNLKQHIQGTHEEEEPLEKRTCPECSRVFKAEYLVRAHITRQHSEEGSQKYREWMKSFLERKRERRRKKAAEKTTICNDCGGVDLFTTQAYVYHRKHFHGDGNFLTVVCELCGKGFGKGKLKRHMEAVHSDGSKPFICESCGKGFKTQAHLGNHIRRTHSEEGRLRYNLSVKMGNRRRKIRTNALAQSLQGVGKEEQSQDGMNTNTNTNPSTIDTTPIPQSSFHLQQHQQPQLLYPSNESTSGSMPSTSHDSNFYSTCSTTELQNFSDFLKKV